MIVIMCRLLLVLMVAAACLLAFTPDLNLAHYTPAKTLRWLGFGYRDILGYEHHLLSAMHLLIGFTGVLLLFGARLFGHADPRRRLRLTILVGLLACVLLEYLQPLAGRRAGLSDLLFGFLGVGCAGLLIRVLVIRRQQW